MLNPIAIFHFTVKIIKRSTGRSAVVAAAYRSGEKLINECTTTPARAAGKAAGRILPSGCKMAVREGKVEKSILYWCNQNRNWGKRRKSRRLALLHFQPQSYRYGAASSCQDGMAVESTHGLFYYKSDHPTEPEYAQKACAEYVQAIQGIFKF